ncbi:MAG: SDR family NAD(P)-dependent oxidoreductase, partial [Chloroflexota bacterium]|nr:SDR family NAD(P)-dependent oxidoreductase [Chloroflexota bacterium]
MSRLSGKVAIVTGAAGGMGLATTRLFAEEGARVVATDVQAELLQKEVGAIDSTGEKVLGLVMDVSSPEDWQKVVDQTVKKFGRVDILVNNAGILISKGILETDPATWEKIIAINAAGVL